MIMLFRIIHKRLFSIVAVWFVLFASAQERQAPEFRVRVDLVSLDVEVLDQQGVPVPDLGKADFVVKENGKSVEISNFAWLTDRTVSLAIVLDTSAISQEKISFAKRFISLLVHLLDPEDEIALYSFDTRDVYLETDLTSDRPLLSATLDNVGVKQSSRFSRLKNLFRKSPRTGLAIDLALRKLQSSSREKKALLIISNRFRGLGPATVEHVESAGHTVFALSFKNKLSAITNLGGDAINKNQLLDVSGGRSLPATQDDENLICRNLAFSLKNHYGLAYYTRIETSDNKPRKIEVSLQHHPYLVFARRSYAASK